MENPQVPVEAATAETTQQTPTPSGSVGAPAPTNLPVWVYIAAFAVIIVAGYVAFVATNSPNTVMLTVILVGLFELCVLGLFKQQSKENGVNLFEGFVAVSIFLLGIVAGGTILFKAVQHCARAIGLERDAGRIPLAGKDFSVAEGTVTLINPPDEGFVWAVDPKTASTERFFARQGQSFTVTPRMTVYFVEAKSLIPSGAVPVGPPPQPAGN